MPAQTENSAAGRRGFTLMEMLVVVAIIAVLVAIAIPVFSSSLEKARAATCTYNRRALLGELTYTMALDGLDQTRAEEIKATYGDMCPSKGEISVTINDRVITVRCSVHTDAMSSGGNSNPFILDDFRGFVKDPDNGVPSNQQRNDEYRKYYFEKNNNQWPTMTVDGKLCQIEPYWSTSGEVWLLARWGDGTYFVNSWSAPLVYNEAEGQWYAHYNQYNGKIDGSNVKADSLEELQSVMNKEIGKNGETLWKPISVTYTK